MDPAAQSAAAVSISVRVNGERIERQVEPRLLLSDFLRQDLQLTGTHVGCEHGVCGACTVLLDDEPVRACLVFAVQVDGHSVTTVEGLVGADGALHPLQEAFRATHALQCGFCTPGFLMSLAGFAADNANPGEAEIRDAMAGNLCRCTGYQHIVDAVVDGAARMRANAADPAAAPDVSPATDAPDGRDVPEAGE